MGHAPAVWKFVEHQVWHILPHRSDSSGCHTAPCGTTLVDTTNEEWFDHNYFLVGALSGDQRSCYWKLQDPTWTSQQLPLGHRILNDDGADGAGRVRHQQRPGSGRKRNLRSCFQSDLGGPLVYIYTYLHEGIVCAGNSAGKLK